MSGLIWTSGTFTIFTSHYNIENDIMGITGFTESEILHVKRFVIDLSIGGDTPEQISETLATHGIDAPAEWVKEVIEGESC